MTETECGYRWCENLIGESFVQDSEEVWWFGEDRALKFCDNECLNNESEERGMSS